MSRFIARQLHDQAAPRRLLAGMIISVAGLTPHLPVMADVVETKEASAEARVESATILPPLEVIERRDVHDAQTSFGTLDEDLQARPLTMQSIDEAEFRARGGRRLSDLQDFIPGVFSGSGDSEERTEDSLSIRGYENYYPLVNGVRHLRVDPGALSLANIERIEVLKGAAGVESGTVEPGGSVNVVTRKPQWRDSTSFGLETGTGERLALRGDRTGPINSQWAYRLIGSGAIGENFRGQPQDEFLLAPSLAWQPTPQQQWLIESSVAYTDYGFETGLPYVKDAGFRNDFAPRRFSYQDDGGHTRQRDRRVAVYGRWQFLERTELRLSSSVEHRDTETQGLFPFGNSLYAGGSTNSLRFSGNPVIDRSFFTRDNPNQRGLAGQLQLVHGVSTGAVDHRLGLSIQTLRERFEQRLRFGSEFKAQNLFDPGASFASSSQPLNASNADVDPVDARFGADIRQDSAHLQYVGDWRRLHWLLGVRRDDAEYRVRFQESSSSIARRENNLSRKNALRLGGSVQLAQDWRLYATGSTAFLPQEGITVDGSPVRPSRGTNIEVGLRFHRPALGQSMEISLFQVKVDDFVLSDPTAPLGFFRINSGVLRSSGVEWTGHLELPGQRSLGIFGTYYDARIERGGGDFDGRRLPNAPYFSGGLRAYQGMARIGLPHTGAELAIIHAGERRAGLFYQYDRDYRMPAYTRLDLNIEHRINARVGLGLFVQNLLDTEYVVAGGTNPWLNFPGERRSAVMQLRYQY